MNYVSTRGGAAPTTFRDALLRGMAPDGGLYMPARWPTLSAGDIRAAAARPYADLAADILGRFAGDSLPPAAVRAAADRLTETFHHAAITPLVQLEPNLWVLELFHGPTAAFKDLAMQMMAVLTDAALEGTGQRLLLLTATSGDTGAAAVRAFAGATSVDLAVLHPLDRVSPVQRRQMTTVDAPNVLNLAVRGDFDDCQRLVKAILADETLREGRRVSSVNSINWGRLAGQVPYYVAAASALGAPHVTPRFVVPTGNFGDAFAGFVARQMGLPIERIVVATNSNDILARAFADGRYARGEVMATQSPAMDIQSASNFERLYFEAVRREAVETARAFAAFGEAGHIDIPPAAQAFMGELFTGVSVSEDETARTMLATLNETGELIDPHTAVGVAALRQARDLPGPIIVLSTAHPAKFPEAVAAATSVTPDLPRWTQSLAARPERFDRLPADAEAIKACVRAFAES